MVPRQTIQLRLPGGQQTVSTLKGCATLLSPATLRYVSSVETCVDHCISVNA